MKKTINNKANGNVFKTIVRGVVKAELVVFGKSFNREVKEELKEEIEDIFDKNYTKYRDDVLGRLVYI